MTTLATRASAFWLAWKYVLCCLALLAASVWLNVYQWKKALTAPIRAENAALTEAMGRFNRIDANRSRDDVVLGKRLDAIANKIPDRVTRYVEVAGKAPLAEGCHPGTERQAAVNTLLGADKP